MNAELLEKIVKRLIEKEAADDSFAGDVSPNWWAAVVQAAIGATDVDRERVLLAVGAAIAGDDDEQEG